GVYGRPPGPSPDPRARRVGVLRTRRPGVLEPREDRAARRARVDLERARRGERAVCRGDGARRRDPGRRVLRARRHGDRRARRRHPGQTCRHRLCRPRRRRSGAGAPVRLRGRPERGHVAVHPGGPRPLAPLAESAVVRAWIAAGALALAACATTSGVDRGTTLMPQGNDAGATAPPDEAVRDSPTSAAPYPSCGAARATNAPPEPAPVPRAEHLPA